MVKIEYFCDLCGQKEDYNLYNLQIPKEIVVGIKGGTSNQSFPILGYKTLGLEKELEIINCSCCKNCAQKIANYIKSIKSVM